MMGRMMKLCIGVILHLLQLMSLADNHPTSDLVESRLIRRLFANYSVSARPVISSDEGITVSISFTLQSIQKLIIRSEQLEMQSYLHVEWYDPRLSWDPAEYDGKKLLVIPPTTPIWMPRFTLRNTEDTDIYRESHYKLMGTRVTYDGLVIWEPGGIITTSCDVDITYYPFDTQECEIIYGNWIYPNHQVNLTYTESAVDNMLEMYQANGEWDLIHHTVSRQDNYDKVTDLSYPIVRFAITLRRKWLYYMMNLVCPALLLMFLQLFAFYLPPDSGDKINFGLTILLSFVVFVIVISENIPTTSDAVPLIEIFLLVCLVSIVIQVILSIFALRLQSMVTTYPPGWLQRLCCDGRKKREQDEEDKATGKTDAYTNHEMAPSKPAAESDGGGGKAEVVRLLEDIRTLLAKSQSASAGDDKMDDMKQAWRDVIIAVDRFFFWFFAVFLAILFIAIVVISPSAAEAAAE